MQYYIMKSSMEMFDLSRAYGLAQILDTLRQERGQPVIVKKCDLYYLIEGPEINLDKQFDKNVLQNQVLPNDQNWSKVLISLNSKKKIEKKVKFIIKFISEKENLQKILDKSKEPIVTEIIDSKGETLLESMDLTATKGIRVPVRCKTQYTDGENIKVSTAEWVLGAIGAVHFTFWCSGDFMTCILPQPQEIHADTWRDIRSVLVGKKINRVSVNTTLAHIAVLLAKELQQRRINKSSFTDRFLSLIYSALVKTGKQWKPRGGGYFPLEFLYKLIDSNLQISGEILDLWDHYFNIGNFKGREDLVVSLADFIFHPTLENFELHSKVCLRYFLNKKVKIKQYQEECLKEVIKNVGD